MQSTVLVQYRTRVAGEGGHLIKPRRLPSRFVDANPVGRKKLTLKCTGVSEIV